MQICMRARKIMRKVGISNRGLGRDISVSLESQIVKQASGACVSCLQPQTTGICTLELHHKNPGYSKNPPVSLDSEGGAKLLKIRSIKMEKRNHDLNGST